MAMTINELVDEMRDELDELIGYMRMALGRDEHQAALDRYAYFHKWYLKAIDVRNAAWEAFKNARNVDVTTVDHRTDLIVRTVPGGVVLSAHGTELSPDEYKLSKEAALALSALLAGHATEGGDGNE